MAELVFALSKNDNLPSTSDMRHVIERIAPHDISTESVLERDAHSITAVVAPDGIPREGNSVCLGQIRSDPDWERIGTGRPDGVYTILRQNVATAEIITDVVGSRPIWYGETDSSFVASTSQRAIACLFGEFSIDESTAAWLLSTGTLGPNGGWDARVKMVPPNTTITIDKRTVNYDLTRRELEIGTGKSDPSRFAEKLHETIEGYDIDLNNWYLTLSGGRDSRTVLSVLAQNGSVDSVTWGLPDAFEYEQNDAVIAEQLAAEYESSHEFLSLSVAEPERALENYILASEGCVDHISGYVDGMGIWERFAAEDKVGIIRGDVPLCYESLQPALLKDLRHGEFGTTRLADAQRPYRFFEKQTESRLAHRYRVYYSYELPVELSALTRIKTPYTEVFNPLLTNSFVEWIAELPESSLHNKSVLKAYCEQHCSSLPLATSPAIPARNRYLRRSDVDRLLRNELAEHDGTIVPGAVLEFCISKSSTVDDPDLLSAGERDESLTRKLKNLVPDDFKRALHEFGYVDPDVDANSLAFRSYIIIRMNRYLNSDAQWGRSVQ